MENIDEEIADELLENIRHGDAEAVRKLEELAAKGNARAMSNLATVFFKGLGGVDISYKKAAKLFRKAAALDEVFALATLGIFYRDSKCGFEQDGHKSAEFFIRAAKRGDERIALYELAEFYRKGKAGLKPDGYKVIEYLARLGDFKGIAKIYRDGECNVQADGRKAIEYFLKADAAIDEAVNFTRKFFERNSNIARERLRVLNLRTSVHRRLSKV